MVSIERSFELGHTKIPEVTKFKYVDCSCYFKGMQRKLVSLKKSSIIKNFVDAPEINSK